MPYKYYHGRTGKVFHVVNRAIGVLVNKRVRHRVMVKRIYLRTEHVKPSKCRDDFIRRCHRNLELVLEAKRTGKPCPRLKRLPAQPKKGFLVNLEEGKKGEEFKNPTCGGGCEISPSVMFLRL